MGNKIRRRKKNCGTVEKKIETDNRLKLIKFSKYLEHIPHGIYYNFISSLIKCWENIHEIGTFDLRDNLRLIFDKFLNNDIHCFTKSEIKNIDKKIIIEICKDIKDKKKNSWTKDIAKQFGTILKIIKETQKEAIKNNSQYFVCKKEKYVWDKKIKKMNEKWQNNCNTFRMGSVDDFDLKMRSVSEDEYWSD